MALISDNWSDSNTVSPDIYQVRPVEVETPEQSVASADHMVPVGGGHSSTLAVRVPITLTRSDSAGW